jgi:hypothetical protein
MLFTVSLCRKSRHISFSGKFLYIGVIVVYKSRLDLTYDHVICKQTWLMFSGTHLRRVLFCFYCLHIMLHTLESLL